MATPQELLEMLEERFVMGEISEEMYRELRSTFLERIAGEGNPPIQSPSFEIPQVRYCNGCRSNLGSAPGEFFRCDECEEVFCLNCRVVHPDGLRLPLCRGCGGPLVEKLIAERPRFTVDAEGVITDGRTGLEWLVGPDKDITWDGSERWVERQNAGGGRWRLPKLNEVGSLYEEGKGTRNMDPVFDTSGWWVWSCETEGAGSAWLFYFNGGEECSYDRSVANYGRVFAVRTRR